MPTGGVLMDYRDKSLLLVIFGITGDLAQRKLLPALYHLHAKGELPAQTRIVGISRRHVSVASVFSPVVDYLESAYDTRALEELQDKTEMVELDVNQAEDYKKLLVRLKDLSEEIGPGVSRLYYLSIPANAFIEIVSNLGKTGHQHPFSTDMDQPRLLVEKPFGRDTESAKALVRVADENFGEQQTFRIDHYLAKETAQNILTFRFGNPLFQSIWNARHISEISICAHETIGIENRVEFYEHTGALRDIIQSHLLQLLALITMEAPAELDSTNIHKSKLRLLESIKTIATAEVSAKATRGQYDSYRREVKNRSSATETFARLQLEIDNEQWRGAKVTLETGKALSEKNTQVLVKFRATETASGTNALIFRLQPKEGITLLLQAKQPGIHNDTDEVEMDFDYQRSFGGTAEAYERVIVDAIRGDQSL
ncbi:MAG: glucose-6-phosphate dehydrogenase, partial [Candidatus Saccharimonadales bacterium]